MKRFVFSLAILLALAVMAPAEAQTGNAAPPGAHYSLNIIGVEKGKTADMTGSNRHTIFVGLGNGGVVTSKIFLTRGPDFRVCDGNAFDTATDCDGNVVAQTGAVFQLPCNLNLPTETGVDLIPCTTGDSALYEVYARALGKPGGSATITTCATDFGLDNIEGTADDVTVCSTENVILVREKGQSLFTNVTKELTSLVAQLDADPNLERVALFAGGFEEWFWQYDNKGLKLAQIRFYLL